jgi:hypothetical protein
MVIWARVFLVLRADEGKVLHPGDVTGVRSGKVTLGKSFRVQGLKFFAGDEFSAQSRCLGS